MKSFNLVLILNLAFANLAFSKEKIEEEKITTDRQNKIIATLYPKYFTDETQCPENDTATPVVYFGSAIKGHFSSKEKEQILALLTVNTCNNPPHYHRGVLLLSEDEIKILSDESLNFESFIELRKSSDIFDEVAVKINDKGKKRKQWLSFVGSKVSLKPYK